MIIATIGHQNFAIKDLESANELLRILHEATPLDFKRAPDGYVYVEDDDRSNVEVKITGKPFLKESDYNLLCMAKTEE